ncbi:Sphingomyelin phosphodiesterase 4 [Trichoplax sp. H2]|nr:Sphingomyelin phosphodiesterase 4 [Trichoplax sp. H2]|eukprot:RDD39003.1 Sphingomyelin phosphodiesterase 4 [Trichoplax sp. H2]
MATGQIENIEVRYSSICQKPLRERCQELTTLTTEYHIRELQHIFPQLVRDIFGCGKNHDWGIFSSHRVHDRWDTDTLENFLSPYDGGIFGMINKLEREEIRFDYPLKNIPMVSRNQLQQGIKSMFYAKRVKIQTYHNNCEMIIGLSLCILFFCYSYNLIVAAFDYYFFHFASSLLTAPELMSGLALTTNMNESDDLYCKLVEKYLNYFLPADGSPIKSTALGMNKSIATSPTKIITNRFHGSRLLKPTMTVMEESFTGCSNSMKDAVERSDALVQIFAEIWLNCNNEQEITQQNSSNISSSFRMQQNASTVPSYDHVRIVRRFIKHMHYFCNCSKGKVASDVINYSLNSTFSATESLRRIAIPEYIAKKLFGFLQFSFDHWPMDSSFRVVLETWLSYLQPWRYLDINEKPLPSSMSDAADIRKWKEFVFNNIGVYSILFHKYLLRALRSDLTSTREAHLLMRVSKVMNQPGLMNIIDEGEALLLSDNGRMMESYTNNEQQALTNMQKHLDSLSIIYQPILEPNMRDMIKKLLKIIIEATRKLKMTSEKAQKAGFINSVVSYFSAEFETEQEKDATKTIQYLEQARYCITEMYQISQSEENTILANVESQMPGNTRTNLPDHTITGSGLTLTPLGRYQVMNGLRKFDRLPARVSLANRPIRRSSENAFLARFFYNLAVYINIYVMGKAPTDDPGMIAVFLRYFASYSFICLTSLICIFMFCSSIFRISVIIAAVESVTSNFIIIFFLILSLWTFKSLAIVGYQQFHGNNRRKRTSVR